MAFELPELPYAKDALAQAKESKKRVFLTFGSPG